MTEIATNKIRIPSATRAAGWLALLHGCVLAAACAVVDGPVAFGASASRATLLGCIVFGSVGLITAVLLLIGGALLARGKRAGRTMLLVTAWTALPLIFAGALVAGAALNASRPGDVQAYGALNFHMIAAGASAAFILFLTWMLLTGRTREWSDAELLSHRPPLPPGLAPRMQVTALLSLIFAFLPPVLVMQMISLGLGMGALGAIRRSAGARTGRVMAIIGVSASSLFLVAMALGIGVGVTALYLETSTNQSTYLVSQRLMELNVAQQGYSRLNLDPQNPGGDCTTSIADLLARTANLNAMEPSDAADISAGHEYHGYHFSMVRFTDGDEQDSNHGWAILAWPTVRNKFQLGPPANAQMLESNGTIIELKNVPGAMPGTLTHDQVSQWRVDDSDTVEAQWMIDLDRPRTWTDSETADANQQPIESPAREGVGASLYNNGLAESVLPGRQLRAICWFRAYLAVAPQGPNADDATRLIEQLDGSLSDRADAVAQKMTELAARLPDGSDEADAAHKAIDEVQTHIDGVKQTTLACDVGALVSPEKREKAWQDYLQNDLTDPLVDEDPNSPDDSSTGSSTIDKLQTRAEEWLDHWQEVRQLLPEQNCLAGAKIQEQEEAIRCLAFSPDGKTLAIGGHDHTVRIWNLAASSESAKLEGHTDSVNCLAFTADGSTLVSGGAAPDDNIYIWDIATARENRHLSGHTSAVQSVTISPDGQTIASASLDSTIRLWDLTGGNQKSQMSGDIGRIDDLAISPDGRFLASAGEDKIIRLWDVAAQSESGELTGHSDAVNCLAFSPDGKTIASGSMDNTVRLWNVTDKTQIASLEGHSQLIHAVKFSRDGRWLFSLGMDGTLRVWDIATAKEKARLIMSDDMSCMALSPDGQTLATGDDQSEVQLWRLGP